MGLARLLVNAYRAIVQATSGVMSTLSAVLRDHAHCSPSLRFVAPSIACCKRMSPMCEIVLSCTAS